MIPELIVREHLDRTLHCPVSLETLDEDFYVLVERLSGDDGFIRHVSFAIQSYGASLFDACMLNEEVKRVMRTLIRHPEVSRVDLDADYNYTDEQLKKYRYQAVYDLVLFGEET